MPAHGVNLIYENYAGLVFLCHIEEVAHPRCTDADVHFNEVGTGHREERNSRLTGNSLRKERFTCARRAYKKHALGDTRTPVREFFGLFEELDDLGKLKLFLLCARNVGKAHLNICGYARLALCERHRAPCPARRRTDDKPEHYAQKNKAAHRDD